MASEGAAAPTVIVTGLEVALEVRLSVARAVRGVAAGGHVGPVEGEGARRGGAHHRRAAQELHPRDGGARSRRELSR